MQPLLHANATDSSPQQQPQLTLRTKIIRISASLVTFAACVLLIIAVAAPAMYHYNIPVLNETVDIGPFSFQETLPLSYVDGGPDFGITTTMMCTVDPSCQCYFQFQFSSTPIPAFPVVDKCDMWNAARAMLLCAIAFSFFGFLCQIFSVLIPPYIRIHPSFGAPGSVGVNFMSNIAKHLTNAGIVLPILGVLCGIISIIMYVSEKSNDAYIKARSVNVDGIEKDVTYGYGFFLMIAGSVTMLPPLMLAKYKGPQVMM